MVDEKENNSDGSLGSRAGKEGETTINLQPSSHVSSNRSQHRNELGLWGHNIANTHTLRVALRLPKEGETYGMEVTKNGNKNKSPNINPSYHDKMENARSWELPVCSCVLSQDAPAVPVLLISH